ncbi:MAG: TlpA family protein disulfide reductase [Kiritimatiellae bacterium]|nr:TlpA family protein disulfide reductase [Kiritimatiellia bacterium]
MKTFALSLLLALTLPLMAAVGNTVSQDVLPKVWLSGEAPQAWPSDDLWLFECWATWCRPCVAAIPHMEAIWKDVKDESIRIVGVNVGDQKTAEQLKAFLAKQPTPPTYAIAIDGDGCFAEAMGVRGIPTAFVVRKGKVVWQGHPNKLTVGILRKFAKSESGVTTR